MMDVDEFLEKFDTELHQIYYLMQAYFYNAIGMRDDTPDAISLPYEHWSIDFYHKIRGDESRLLGHLAIYSDRLHNGEISPKAIRVYEKELKWYNLLPDDEEEVCP